MSHPAPATGSEPVPAPVPSAPDPAPAPVPAAPAAGTEPAEPQPATGTTPATGQDPAPATSDAAAPAADEAAKWKALARKHEDQNKATRAQLEELRTSVEADKAARQQQMDQLAVAFGLKTEEATPEQLAQRAQAERDAAQAQAATAAAEKRAADVELAVLRAAYATGVNGNALLDSRTFVSAVSGFDPAAADFSERVTEAITTAVAANPGYKTAVTPVAPAAPLAPAAPAPVTPTVPRSGGEFNAAPGGNRQWTLEDVRSASPREVQEAWDAGYLTDLGYHPKAKNKR